MNLFSKKFFIEYCDTDDNCEITNKGFLRYMQEVAMLHSDEVGYSSKTVTSTNKAWLLLNWKIKVFKRPIWSSEITVQTWERSLDKYFAYRDFEILDKYNQIVAIASSKWVLVDATTHSLCLLDEYAASANNVLKKSVFGTFKFAKLKPQDTFESSLNYTILKHDLDSNHHVNNLNYIDFAYEVLPLGKDYSDLEISYLKESKLNDTLEITFTSQGDTDIVTIRNLTQNCISAIISCK